MPLELISGDTENLETSEKKKEYYIILILICTAIIIFGAAV